MRRYELVWMGSIAAVAGIGLAALLTASFGARSSGAPAALRPSPPATAAATGPALVERAPVRAHVARIHVVRKRHRHARHPVVSAHRARPIAAPAPAKSPVPTRTTADFRPTQTVDSATPAPAPKPVKRVSQPAPKHSAPTGFSFDDSG